MVRILDFNESFAERSATVASIRALKGSDRQMIEVTAAGAEDAAAAEAAGIEMVICEPSGVEAVRQGSTRVFVTVAVDFAEAGPPLTEEQMLAAASEALSKGADAVATSRRPQTVRRLTDEYIPVMGHVGFVPRRSSHLGGVRGVGKTADEAATIWDEIRRLEDAGAFAVECELIAADMMALMTEKTCLATISLGSGGAADVMCLFTSDICGEGGFIPRHARTYADLNALHARIQQERCRALAAFRADVDSRDYPNASEIIETDHKELERFVQLLDRHS